MALCSQLFSSPTKRCCQYSNAPPTKRICLKSISSTKSVPPVLSEPLSSSSSDDDDSDDEACYNQDQIKAKKRNNLRVIFNLDLKLSKAISQYCDDDEDINETNIVTDGCHEPFIRRGSLFENNHHHDQENLDCKLGSSPSTTKLFSDNLLSNNNLNCQSGSNINNNTKIPDCDKSARSRCFEYLVGAIDEAWARYCDQATYVEDEVYGYNTPSSMIATDDEEFDVHTDITDYDSDFEFDPKNIQSSQSQGQQQQQQLLHHQQKLHQEQEDQQQQPKSFRPRLYSTASTKEDPSSCQLQALKDRLTKAKYYLQDLVDSDEVIDVSNFWKRWDMIKYATIELVEDDDDDEIIESTIDELENGRYFIN